MEKLKHKLLELWNHVLLVHRTMVIKAESKRRKAILHAHDRNNNDQKAILLPDHNQRDCHKDGHSMMMADASSSAATPSAMHNWDRSHIKRVFNLVDENKDGLISAEELQLYMKKLGMELSDQDVRDMVGTVDRNSDDYVDFEEFLSLYSPLRREGGESSTPDSQIAREDDEGEEALLKAFFVFDKNRDGLISVLELQQVLLKLGLREGRSLMSCQQMIARVDADSNGKVDFFEFKEMMCSKAFTFGKAKIGLPLCPIR